MKITLELLKDFPEIVGYKGDYDTVRCKKEYIEYSGDAVFLKSALDFLGNTYDDVITIKNVVSVDNRNNIENGRLIVLKDGSIIEDNFSGNGGIKIDTGQLKNLWR